MPRDVPSGGTSADELATKLRGTMPDESTIDLEEHARRISLVALLGKLRGPRRIFEESEKERGARP